MTEFIGPRSGWEEHAKGTVRFEIDLELWSNSGRSKHIDLDEQGAWLAQDIAVHLKNREQLSDVAIHDIRYYGTDLTASGEAISEIEIGLTPKPTDPE